MHVMLDAVVKNVREEIPEVAKEFIRQRYEAGFMSNQDVQNTMDAVAVLSGSYFLYESRIGGFACDLFKRHILRRSENEQKPGVSPIKKHKLKVSAKHILRRSENEQKSEVPSPNWSLVAIGFAAIAWGVTDYVWRNFWDPLSETEAQAVSLPAAFRGQQKDKNKPLELSSKPHQELSPLELCNKKLSVLRTNAENCPDFKEVTDFLEKNGGLKIQCRKIEEGGFAGATLNIEERIIEIPDRPGKDHLLYADLYTQVMQLKQARSIQDYIAKKCTISKTEFVEGMIHKTCVPIAEGHVMHVACRDDLTMQVKELTAGLRFPSLSECEEGKKKLGQDKVYEQMHDQDCKKKKSK